MGIFNSNSEKERDKINFLWIDAKIENEENSYYQDLIAENKNYNSTFFNQIHSAEEELKKNEYHFKPLIIMISGNLFRDFMTNFQKSLKDIFFHPRIIVFTWDKNLFYEKCKKENINLIIPCFNKNEVYSDFDEIKQILSQKKINYISNNTSIQPLKFNGIFERDNMMKLEEYMSTNILDEDLTFERIENYGTIQSLMSYFEQLKEPDPNDIVKFNKFLVEKFKDNNINYLINQIEEDSLIPSEILLKYWLRLYSLESQFYREMNDCLRKKKGAEYSTLIREIYKGFRINFLKPFASQNLYRGSIISKSELNGIKNLLGENNEFPDILVLIRSFLSFSKNKEKAISFIKEKIPEDFEKVLYIIEGNANEKYVFNASIEKYSYFPSEEEILFFPYCGLAINKIIKKNDYTEIHLNYLNKYINLIEKTFGEDQKETIPIENELSKNGLVDIIKINWYKYLETENFENPIECLFLFENNDIAIANNNSIEIYSLEDNKKKLTINIHKEKCNYLIHLKTDLICSASSDFTINIIKLFDDNTKYQVIQELNAHTGTINMILLSKKNDLISCSNDKTIIIWKYENNEYTIKDLLKGHKSSVNMIAESENGEIISLSSDGCLYFWKEEKNKFKSIFYLIFEKSKNQNIIIFDNYLFFSTNRKIYLLNAVQKKTIDEINFDKEIIIMKKMPNQNFILCLKNEKDMNYLMQEYRVFSKNNKMKIECIGSAKIEDKIIYNIIIKDNNTILVDGKTIKVYGKGKKNALINKIKKSLKIKGIKKEIDIYRCIFYIKEEDLNKKIKLFKPPLFEISVDKNVIKSSDSTYIFSKEGSYIFNLGFNKEKLTNMSKMFFGSKELIDFDGSDINENNIEDMNSLFSHCYNLININLSQFYTFNVLNMKSMFYSCESLIDLNLSNFNTCNVTDMSYMFANCKSLKNLYLKNFNTSKVTNMSYMFANCKSLKNLDLINFDTYNVTDMSYMFADCQSLLNLDLINFNTCNVTNMNYMFNNCQSLLNLEISNFRTCNVTNMSYMFDNCKSLKYLKLNIFNTSKVTNMSYMFANCQSLLNLDLSNFYTCNVTNMSYVFSNCHL